MSPAIADSILEMERVALLFVLSVACGSSSSASLDAGPAAVDGGARVDAGPVVDASISELPIQEFFDGTALPPDFSVLHAGAVSELAVSDGQLQVTTESETVWWMSQNNALYVYQSINVSDFAVTTAVRARRSSQDSMSINSGYHYAGPMIRTPSSDPAGPQNFTFVAVGYQGGCDGGASNCIESKSTVSDESSIERLQLAGATDVQLRLCKVGSSVTAYYRPSIGSGNWIERDSWTRDDMAGNLQVGLMAFSFSVEGDQLRALYDDFEIRAVGSAADCLLP